MSTLGKQLRSEAGEGLVSGLILIAGVLLPLLFLVPLFARLEQGRLLAEQAARDAVRAAVAAPTADAARLAASDALARADAQTNDPLELELSGTFERGSELSATASVRVALASLPLLGNLGTITLHGQASTPVDRYRSLPAAAP
jgi:hypothetical protein